MDLDLLKHGPVPISPDTVLGFEFLLDKNLLYQHLQKENPDPSPTDLIIKFYDVIAVTLRNNIENENSDQLLHATTTTTTSTTGELINKNPIKNVALKILALKVSAYLNWDLASIRSLPFETQVNLLHDLIYFTSENKIVVEISNIEPPDPKSASPQFLFAILLFFRWVLNISMHRVTSNWQQRYGKNDISPLDESIICCPENIKKTLNFLVESLEWEKFPHLLSFDSFQVPTESNDSVDFQWNLSKEISKDEFLAQISYELGTFFFYSEDYEAAKLYFLKSDQYFKLTKHFSGFSTLNESALNVYVKATDPERVNVGDKSLLEQLNNSIVNQFVGITNVLQLDNLEPKIPLSYRINLELDIQGALSSGIFTVARDLLYKVKALNFVRSILDRKFLNEFSINVEKNADALIWAIQLSWKQFNEDYKNTIKIYLLNQIIKESNQGFLNKILNNDILKNIFTDSDLKYVIRKDHLVQIPDSLFKNDFSISANFNKKRKPRMELKVLTNQLINSYDWQEIKEIITKINSINFIVWNIFEINPKWELPIPLPNVIRNLPRGITQEFIFVLLAKSKEQLINKNWNLALEFLIVLEKDLQTNNSANTFTKLIKMISWEVLLVQIVQFMEEWPKTNIDKTALANACEGCLQTNDSVLPRTEIVKYCGLCLLNLGRWEFLINFEKRWPIFEIMSAISLASIEITKNKGIKKFSKDLWELVLPIFCGSSQSKRSSSSNYHHDVNLKSNLMMIFLQLKDTKCFTVVLSMLSKFFNIFKDDSNLELQIEFINLWPTSISNTNPYNINVISEILLEILKEALKVYPSNVPWLRLMADVNYANGNYKSSISEYLKSLIIYYDYFNIPVRYDDHIFRRILKCCQALECSTQAAVLCQFLEEPDYSLAFRLLGEQKSCNDAVDAYYHCFWDTNILEYLIHVHNRRGEFQRRKCSTQVVGMLELNSNNNEEIQREASNLRKSIFLRSLCKQFVV